MSFLIESRGKIHQAPATGSQPPQVPAPTVNSAPVDQPTLQGNLGNVDIENRVFRESLAVIGTPFTLEYSSERMPGTIAGMTIQLTTNSYPSPLKRILLQVLVAGRIFETNFLPSTNLTYDFSWDGRDSYGRRMYGENSARVRIGYSYDGYYVMPPSMRASFGFPSGTWVPGSIPTREDITLWQQYDTTIRYSEPSAFAGIGGWTLNVHHNYDPVGKMLSLGTGKKYHAQDETPWVITTFAGTGQPGSSGDGGAAANATLKNPSGVTIGPDGSVYISDSGNSRVRRVSPDGIISTVAGGGGIFFDRDGNPATNVTISAFRVAVKEDGSFYIDDLYRYIWRVDTNGLIWTFAGNGGSGWSGDGGPATNATISPYGIAMDKGGAMYIADGYHNYRVRRVGPDGIIATVAGTGSEGSSGDGGPATNATLKWPYDAAVGPDGAVFIADLQGNCIRKIGVDGIIHTVAGSTAGSSGFNGDGGLAVNALLNSPAGGPWVAMARCILPTPATGACDA